MVYCFLMNSHGKIQKLCLNLNNYLQLLQIFYFHVLNFNYSYVLYEVLFEEYVRVFFRIRNIPKDNYELIDEIIKNLIRCLNLPSNYALTFHNNSQNEQKLCYNVFFPVMIKYDDLNELIRLFHEKTNYKYHNYVPLVPSLNVLEGHAGLFSSYSIDDLPYDGYFIRAVYSGKYQKNQIHQRGKIIKNHYKLLKGELKDTIIQNTQNLRLYDPKFNKMQFNQLKFMETHTDKDGFKYILSKKQKKNFKLQCQTIKYIDHYNHPKIMNNIFYFVDDFNLYHSFVFIKNFESFINKQFNYNEEKINKRLKYLDQSIDELLKFEVDCNMHNWKVENFINSKGELITDPYKTSKMLQTEKRILEQRLKIKSILEEKNLFIVK